MSTRGQKKTETETGKKTETETGKGSRLARGMAQQDGRATHAQQQLRRAKQAARMAYGRSLVVPTSSRSASTEKVPASIADKIKNSPSVKEHYFDLWMRSKCDWGLVEVHEKIVEVESQQENC